MTGHILRRYLGRLTAALILWTMLTPTAVWAAQAQEEAASQPEEVTMVADYGYDGSAKGGRYVPVRVSFTNPASQPFEGRLQILVMETDFEIYRYSMPVTLEAASESQETVNIPLGLRTDQMYVVLLDDKGQEVIRQRLKFNISLDVAELMVGVLSDTPEKLQYLDGVGINYSLLRTKTTVLTADSFPTDETGLDLMDVILITNYNTNRLNHDQTDAILEWVKKGGTLIFGTGERVAETLGRFAGDLLEEPYQQPSKLSVDMGVEYATNGPGDSFIDLSCVDISLKGGSVILSNDELPVLTAVNYEKGTIAVAAYDFKDIAEFCQVQRSYVAKIFTSLFSEDRINQLSDTLYGGGSNQYWSVQSVINTGNVDKLPNVVLYTILILAYIIFSGPVMYMLFKKYQIRKYYRTGIVVSSLIFTGVIYLVGCKTRFRDTFFTYATIRDVSEESILESTVVNMRTPYNQSYSAAIDPLYTVRPITRNYYDMRPVPKFTGTEDYRVAIDRYTEDTEISVHNVVAFNPQYFQLEKKTENTEKIGLTGDITLFDGSIYGTVTNRYDFAVENAAILTYGQLIMLGRIEAGETISLDGLEVLNYPLSYTSAVAERITGGYQYKKADINDKNYLKALQQTKLLVYYLDNYLTGYIPNARIVAFSTGEEEGNFLAKKNRYECSGLTILTSTVSINTTRGGEVCRSALMRRPNATSGNYKADSHSMFGIDPTVLEYSLGSDLDVEKITFNRLSPAFTEDEKYKYIVPFHGTVSFYNYDSSGYDLMDPDKMVYTDSELRPYLSPSNTMTVKYMPENASEYNWDSLLPIPMVTGRRK